METTVKQRLIKFLLSKNFSQGKAEKTIGLSNGFINNIGKTIGADKLQKIQFAFPDLNTDWLLTGEGEMLRTNSVTAQVGDNNKHVNVAGGNIDNKNSTIFNEKLLDMLERRDQQIEKKDQQIELLLAQTQALIDKLTK